MKSCVVFIFSFLIFNNLYPQKGVTSELRKNQDQIKQLLSQTAVSSFQIMDTFHVNTREIVFNDMTIYVRSFDDKTHELNFGGFFIEKDSLFLYYETSLESFFTERSQYVIYIFDKKWKILNKLLISDNYILGICNYIYESNSIINSSLHLPKKINLLKNLKINQLNLSDLKKLHLNFSSNTFDSKRINVKLFCKDLLDIW